MTEELSSPVQMLSRASDLGECVYTQGTWQWKENIDNVEEKRDFFCCAVATCHLIFFFLIYRVTWK